MLNLLTTYLIGPLVKACCAVLAVTDAIAIRTFSILAWPFKSRSSKGLPKSSRKSAQEPAAVQVKIADPEAPVDHFARMALVVDGSLEHSRAIIEQTARASEILDATEYTLHRLLDDLSEIMPQIAAPAFAGEVRRPVAEHQSVIAARQLAA